MIIFLGIVLNKCLKKEENTRLHKTFSYFLSIKSLFKVKKIFSDLLFGK